ncbi:MAG: DUF4145 domain-containing protein [Thermoanaerobaculales bacterium]
MDSRELITRRFGELDKASREPRRRKIEDSTFADSAWYQEWVTNALNLLQGVFGQQSPHWRNLQELYSKFRGSESNVFEAIGVFRAAKSDYEGGYLFNVERSISGEVLGDFVALAKSALREGHKDVAAVLASAALEDALKRYAAASGLSVEDASMQTVVAALKTKGFVSGAQKTLLEAMPKLRDYAMHANWDKLSEPDVGSVIGFVEQFLLSHFSA